MVVNVYPSQLVTDQPQTFHGVKEFVDFPITPSSAPTTDYQVANKKYVDDQWGGIIKSTFLWTTVWGSSTEVITVISGVDSLDISNVTIHTPGWTPVDVKQSYCWTNQITVEFSADPSTDHIINVAIFWPHNAPVLGGWGGWGWSIPWCTDPWAINYNPLATVDNWGCLYD